MEATTQDTQNAIDRKTLLSYSIEELQAHYLQVVGRPTTSTNRRYILWKLKEAEEGRVRVGPKAQKEQVPHKVLPLRLPETTVQAIDKAWARQGLPSRMEFLRRALRSYMMELGEYEAAQSL